MSMKKQLKILNLIDIPWYSGLSDYAFAQSFILKENGHTIYFGCDIESESYKKAIKEGYKTIEITDRKKIITPSLIFKLVKFIRDENIDIINAHTGRSQTLSYILSKFKNIKIIRTKADAKDIKYSFTYKKVSLIICGSKYIENFYKNRGIKKTIVIYKSINPPLPLEIEEKEPFIIGIAGRLDPVKGHIYFINAAIKILQKGYNCLFYIAGKEENIKWKDLLNEIPEKFRKNFVYFGYTNDIFEFMKKCHIGVISSINSEAVSRVAIEWMASKRAVISTNVGALPELIDKNFLVNPKNEDELYIKIAENLDFKKIKEIGEKNFEKIRKDFSFEKFRDETLKVFENLPIN
jgi:glycosyltransferase involved in cell wall biosynthesis